MQVVIKFREHLFEFLSDLSDHFELILFNDNTHCYTMQLYEALQKFISKQQDNCIIEKEIPFSYILSKDHCSINESQELIKDLEFLSGPESNRSLEDCIIVDNNMKAFQRQITNGIYLPKFSQ